ncbi:nucleolar protein [Nadsonia fulvescens var. elongata DSM 6958]|uniref:Pescadillo homolog n=1 Tax=Nadsonia fulvescens var. elongata DSM 6958 TaxID=857566 RepID=A0A1E3PDP0_9ASCO|nr:nucleolar protein [Nadsonia fulvescens var. elongata DSM 6958]
MQIKKKHQAGAAKNFITRTQAVKKLQVSLADFRRLCIFKGIYPREPRSKKKANKGSTAPTTFYYAKDIQYLMHEPVLNKFREHKIFARKLSRALGRGEVTDAKRLDDNKPQYQLDHIIKERYPTFLDALRDIDDALSMLFLFATMPATDKISQRVTEEADKICNQWMAFVAREGCLKKVFVSIKGVYYEAVVRGQEVRWLVPFKFPQNVPTDVDFRIMCTFLEFYTTLLQFILYRLYTESGLVYPPKIDSSKIKGVGGITAYILESKQNALKSILASTEAVSSNTSAKDQQKALESIQSLEMDKIAAADSQVQELDTFTAIPSTETNISDVLEQPKLRANDVSTVFSKFTFFIGREVPLDILEFLIIAFGGKAICESAIDELIDNEDTEAANDAAAAAKRVSLEGVTHQICDRPSIPNKVPGRTYIQPQWIFDCINKGKLLPVAEYGPGETLPPHLSPWGDAHGYDPEAAQAVADVDAESDEEEIVDVDVHAEEQVLDEEDLEHQKELERETAGVYEKPTTASSESKKRKAPITKAAAKIPTTKAEKEAKEEKELKMIMMTNKQKKLYKKMQYGINKVEARDDELKKKRRKIEQTKAKLQKNMSN